MKTKRIKVPQLATREQFNAAVTAAADADTIIRYLEARRDRAIARLQAAYAAKIEPQEAIRDTQAALAETYATTHRAELLTDGKKSLSIGPAKFGWRISNPALGLLKGWTWAKVLEELKRLRFRRWIRVKQEPAKDAMLVAIKQPKAAATLKKIGVELVQEEEFFIEANVETAQAIKTEKAAA